MSTPPSNQANSVSGTLGGDLPANTRYTGTVSFTNMTQNDPFLPMTNNPNAGLTGINSAYGNIPWNQVNFGFTDRGLQNRAYSLNGDIDTLLFNNVLTTKIITGFDGETDLSLLRLRQPNTKHHLPMLGRVG